jgi:tetratricopeptide (TPR) repeat protein
VEQGRAEEALPHCREAVRLRPGYALARNNLGRALQDLGQLEEAAAQYHEALRLKPDYARVYVNLAGALLEEGKPAEAVAHCREALRLEPHNALAYGHIVSLAAEGHCGLTEGDLQAMKDLASDGRLPRHEASHLAFALAEVLDRRGEYDEAFRYCDQANRLQREALKEQGRAFDPDAHQRLIDALIAAFTPDYFQAVHSFGVDAELPVFIVGMPRSGTTLVEQILASHPLAFGAGELRDMDRLRTTLEERVGAPGGFPACIARADRQLIRTLAEQHLERLARLGGQAVRVINKMPDNTLYLGLIATLFPRARIIHCRRNAVDVCLSCYFQHFKSIMYASSLEDIGLYYRQYERLMAHWHAVLPLQLHEVVYEELVANQEPLSRDLIAFCGLDWNDRCLAFHKNRRPVQTASKLQVRRPLYASAVGRWRRYAVQLQPLLRVLGQADQGASEAHVAGPSADLQGP